MEKLKAKNATSIKLHSPSSLSPELVEGWRGVGVRPSKSCRKITIT